MIALLLIFSPFLIAAGGVGVSWIFFHGEMEKQLQHDSMMWAQAQEAHQKQQIRSTEPDAPHEELATSVATPPLTVEEAKAQAVALYPALKDVNSYLNKVYVGRYHYLQQKDKAYFESPDWPLRLAKECAASLGQ